MPNTASSAASLRKIKDYLFGLVPLGGLSVYLYGARPAAIIAAAALSAVLCDLLAAAMRRREPDFSSGDLSSVVYAVIFALMLPASAGYGVVFFGSVVTVMLGKHAFGGYTGCIFHPSAFGFCASAICWPESLFKYPKSFSAIGLGLKSGAALSDAPAYTIKLGGVPNIDRIDLLLGDYPGPMGATFCIILIAILVLFIVRRTMTWHIPVCFLAVSAAYAYLFPRIQTTRPVSVMFELLSGAVVFASVFIVSDPFTSPSNAKAKLLYGALLGVVTMVFSYYGAFQMGVCFAVLLLNPLVPYLDRKFAPREVKLKEGRADVR